MALHPDSVTLVPEKRQEVTTEGGLDLVKAGSYAAEVVKTLKEARIKTAAFVDPDLDQIKEAARMQFDAVEIHTGRYANASSSTAAAELHKIRETAAAVRRLGMAVHAGHGLNYHNTGTVLAISEIEELNIGHAIIARAVFTGLDRAVRDMLKLMGRI